MTAAKLSAFPRLKCLFKIVLKRNKLTLPSEHEQKSRLAARDRGIYKHGRITCSTTVPETLNIELKHKKGKPYHLFSHTFRPKFVKYYLGFFENTSPVSIRRWKARACFNCHAVAMHGLMSESLYHKISKAPFLVYEDRHSIVGKWQLLCSFFSFCP